MIKQKARINRKSNTGDGLQASQSNNKDDFSIFHGANPGHAASTRLSKLTQRSLNKVLPFCIKEFDEEILDIQFIGTNYFAYGLANRVLLYRNIGEAQPQVLAHVLAVKHVSIQ